MESLISGSGASIVLDDNDEGCNAEDRELDVIDTDEINEISEFKQKLEDHDNNDEENEDSKKKTPVWKKPQKKKPAKKQDKNAGKQKKKQKPKSNDPASVQGDSAQNAQVRNRKLNTVTKSLKYCHKNEMRVHCDVRFHFPGQG